MPTVNMQSFEESRRHQVTHKYEVYPLNTVNVEDYQIELTGIASSVKEDVRIIKDDLLDQWVKSKGNAWSKLNNLKAKTPQTILILSGNPSSKDVDDGDATFQFFDDANIKEWNKYSGNPVLSEYTGGVRFDDGYVYLAQVIKNGSNDYFMFYCGGHDAIVDHRDTIGLAKSSNLINWTRYDGDQLEQAIITCGGAGKFDYNRAWMGYVVRENASSWKIWYTGDSTLGGTHICRIGYATSTNGENWTKYNGGEYGDAIFEDMDGASSGARGATDPVVLKESDTDYKMWYMIYQNNKIKYATSTDGINWTIQNGGNAVISTEYGPTDIKKIGSTYYLWTHSTSLTNIKVFTSTDCINWTDEGSQLVPSASGWDTSKAYWGTVFEDSPGDWYMFYLGIQTVLTTDGRIGYAKLTKTLPIIDSLTDKWDIAGGLNEEAFSYSGGFIIANVNGVETELPILSTYSISNDVIMEADIYLGHIAGDYMGIAMRWIDINNHYRFYTTDLVVSIIYDVLDGGLTTNALGITDDTWYEAKAIAAGNILTLYIDDIQMVTRTDATHASGVVGLYTYRGIAKWDNIRVRKHIANEPIIQKINELNRMSFIKALGSRL